MPTPPVAPQQPHATSHHGITRNDPYHWLRAANWQEVFEAPETLPADIRAYLEATHNLAEGAGAAADVAGRSTSCALESAASSGARSWPSRAAGATWVKTCSQGESWVSD